MINSLANQVINGAKKYKAGVDFGISSLVRHNPHLVKKSYNLAFFFPEITIFNDGSVLLNDDDGFCIIEGSDSLKQIIHLYKEQLKVEKNSDGRSLNEEYTDWELDVHF